MSFRCLYGGLIYRQTIFWKQLQNFRCLKCDHFERPQTWLNSFMKESLRQAMGKKSPLQALLCYFPGMDLVHRKQSVSLYVVTHQTLCASPSRRSSFRCAQRSARQARYIYCPPNHAAQVLRIAVGSRRFQLVDTIGGQVFLGCRVTNSVAKSRKLAPASWSCPCFSK